MEKKTYTGDIIVACECAIKCSQGTMKIDNKNIYKNRQKRLDKCLKV